MKRNSSQYRVEGTSALQPAYVEPVQKVGHILPFPGNSNINTETSVLITKSGSFAYTVKKCIQSALDASEMYCSLRFEDFKGVPYRVFTKRGVAALSVSSAALACIAIIVGA